MKVIRIFLIVTAISIAGCVGYAIDTMCWGPDRFEISGQSLPELLQSDVLVVVIGAFISLAVAWLVMRPFARIYFPARIKNGVTAEARVLKVWDTGTTINDDPEVGLLLEFTSADGVPLQVETKTIVSRLKAALVQPGITAQVKYDPQKPRRLQVLTLHLEDVPPKDAAGRMEELNELRDKGLITDEEYRQKREEILRAL
jgi:hypothetical protein